MATSRRGKYGLDICRQCYYRMRRSQASQATPAEIATALRASGPPYEWPLCERCGEPVTRHGLGYYTSKGKQRRFCSRGCRNTANSRSGAPIRSDKAKQRVRAGEWQNPAGRQTPEQHRAISQLGGAARAEQHRAAIEDGNFIKPSEYPGASDKLSRPRVHSDNPLLHRALEKLRDGSMNDLTEAEAEAYRAYRREQARKLRQQPTNEKFRRARLAAGLSQAEIARRLGVSANTVWRWEKHGARPRSSEMREKIKEILKIDPFV